MPEPTLKFSVTCPDCALESVSEISIAVIANGLLSGKSLRLYGQDSPRSLLDRDFHRAGATPKGPGCLHPATACPPGATRFRTLRRLLKALTYRLRFWPPPLNGRQSVQIVRVRPASFQPAQISTQDSLTRLRPILRRRLSVMD